LLGGGKGKAPGKKKKRVSRTHLVLGRNNTAGKTLPGEKKKKEGPPEGTEGNLSGCRTKENPKRLCLL